MQSIFSRSFIAMAGAALFVAMPFAARADATGFVDIAGAVGGGTVINVTLFNSGTTASDQFLCSTAVSGPTQLGDLRIGNGGVTADGLKAIFATLIAAKLAGRQVTVYASNGTSASFGCIVTGASMAGP
jgi:hypothetical protein